MLHFRRARAVGTRNEYVYASVSEADPENCFGRGHIGLELPKTTKRGSEGGEVWTWCLGERHKLPQWGLGWSPAPDANNFSALHTQFCAISGMS